MSRRLLALALVAGAFTAAGCDGDNGTSPSAGPVLGLSFSGLTPLAGGYHYEGWAIIGGQPFSTGKFNVGPDGALRTVGGQPISGDGLTTNVDLNIASAIVITIEPAGDTDAIPATTKVLAGSVSGRSASLTATAPQALGNDFSGASGVFLLATPTDGPGTNETSGIWFIDPSSGTPSAGLSLPVLPAGWEYEGWAVTAGVPLTTGKFLRPSGADFAAPFSGPLPGPPFPGEDYLTNAPAGLTFPRDLGGSTAVITIEPSPDDSPAPFSALRPLVGPIPTGAAPMAPFPLGNGRGVFARGTATFR
jgi:hypothetical protein